MILTGNQIRKEVVKGDVIIDPFSEDQINPNSYNYRLGDDLIVFGDDNKQKTVKIDEGGYVLEPGVMYLAATKEVLGSNKFAMRLIGKSSIGRLGLFLQISADLGHVGSVHNWTLELVAAHKIRIYPGMIIGQITFWESKGKISVPVETYNKFNEPQESLFKI